MSREVTITALGIGHGDAILVDWQDEGAKWTCLIDGGESPDTLKKRLDANHVETIDLLILSHFDNDHIGGLNGITKDRTVKEFWGPALPAYRRHEWLFGTQCRRALERAEELESELTQANANISYPVEDYSAQPMGTGGPRLRVLSPAARILYTLLTSDDVSWLLSSSVMPLGWLLDDNVLDTDQTGDQIQLEAALASFALTNDAIGSSLRRKSTVREVHRGSDPDFFGDSALNNTSLVIWMEAETGGRLHRILLTGDQENWTYLFARHPTGLQAEVLKASHHGGQLFLENNDAHQELFSFIRPRAVLFSASGRHKLPNNVIREAAIQWGAAVFCTSSRGREHVIGSPAKEKGCYQSFCCTGCGQNDVKLHLSQEGIYSSDRMACHSGQGSNPGPVIRIAQHIIEPSPVVNKLAENELRKHISWVGKELKNIHLERRKKAEDPPRPGSAAVPQDAIELRARQSRRHVIIPNLDTILETGANRNRFWAMRSKSYDHSWTAYHLPGDNEIKKFIGILDGIDILVFESDGELRNRDKISILNSLRTGGIAVFCDAMMCLPQCCFKSVIWPTVAKQITKGSWSAYMHASGVFVCCRMDLDVLCRTLIDKLFDHDAYKLSADQLELVIQHVPILADKQGFQILVSKEDGDVSSFDLRRVLSRITSIVAKGIPLEKIPVLEDLCMKYKGFGISFPTGSLATGILFDREEPLDIEIDRANFVANNENFGRYANFLKVGFEKIW